MKRMLLVALLAAAAANAAEPPAAYDQIEERDPTGQFIVGKSTADEIKAKLGAPLAENHNRNGSFVYTYLTPTNDYTSYVFDKSGVLTATRSMPKSN